MESLKWKFLSLALVASMSFLTSCSDGDNNGRNDNDEMETLRETITSDVTLEAGITYKLSGEHIVKAGATLNIETDVKIISVYDDIADYTLIKQGAKINAMDTADAPIVMASRKEEPDVWDGIHICGKTHTSAEGGRGSFEVGGAVYGGNDDAGNSSKLQYVRVEYTGYAFDEEHEANGVAFYGVGSDTIVDHCQAYKGSDNGFKFFGGSVNVSNMVVMSCSNDSFDWTEGWDGEGTDSVAYQEPKATLGYDCDCLTEADSNENDNTVSPISHSTLKSPIFAGNGENKQGVRLRRDTQVHIDNAKVRGKGQPLTIESVLTNGALENGTSLLANMTVSAELTTDGDYINIDFIAITGNKVDVALSYTSFGAIKAEYDWMSRNWVK